MAETVYNKDVSASTEQVREDFDRIARLTAHGAKAADVYHKYLLNQIPPGCKNILDVGCGLGGFTRLLQGRAERVVAIDLSPEMIRLARERSAEHRKIEYVPADFMLLNLPRESFDCVVSLATLHHLPTGDALGKMKDALAPGGVLLIQDLIANDGFVDLLRSAVARPVNTMLRLLKTGRILPPREVRRAWAEHGRHDVYLTLPEVERMCAQHLPGAKVQRHLLWRYTLVWRKAREKRDDNDER
ncbi:MAG: class I SAM-dependent methyltransferase [Acidobacteriota bacterium]|nr:class I SAM-dependent methyltransferase [Acidobacteriota bacterium]